MSTIAGVDGCPAGWVAVSENTKSHELNATIFPTFQQLAEALDAQIIAIDIPIGLTESGARECDVLARRKLGPKRGTSVFPAPIRAALGASTYQDAKAQSLLVQRKAISQQAWAIYPKIREVDDSLRANRSLRDRVIEVHPELTFSSWHGAPIIPGKRTAEGSATRQTLIARHFGKAALASARAMVARSQAANDDLADAFAALWTAQRHLGGNSQTLPVTPPLDLHGLPMRMVY